MKGRWESNISVWFPCMRSHKWICYFQNRIIMFCLPVPHSYIGERFIYFQDRSAFSAAGKYVDRSWEYINRSQTHKCGNWDWGRAIPRKGIHKRNFSCSVALALTSSSFKGVHFLCFSIFIWHPLLEKGEETSVKRSIFIKNKKTWETGKPLKNPKVFHV